MMNVSGGRWVLAVAAGALAVSAAGRARGEGLKLVQVIRNGADGVTRMSGAPNCVRANGPFVYVASPGGSSITWFRRDRQTGRLAHAGELTWRERNYTNLITFAGGRLYSAASVSRYGRTISRGLVSFKLDPKTGAPTEVGRVDCPAAVALEAGKAGENLYLKTNPRDGAGVVRFKIGAAGKVKRMEAVTGRGLGYSAMTASVMAISPDGRNIYTVSGADHAVGILKKGAGGKVSYAGFVDLSVLARKAGGAEGYRWPSLAISPDGKNVYVNLWTYDGSANVVGVFRRSPATGKLSFVGKSACPPAGKGLRMVFGAGGKAVYYGSLDAPVGFCRRDAATGKLTAGGTVRATRGRSVYDLTIIRRAGQLYAAAWRDTLFVLKEED